MFWEKNWDISVMSFEGFTTVGGMLTDVCGTPDYFAPELADIAMNRSATYSSAEATEAARVLAADGIDCEDGKGYGPPLDCWAVGCIVYELLAGHPPYQAQDESVLFYKITENAMEFPEATFQDVSPDAKDLIRCLTRTDPEARLSCQDALSHPWVRDAGEAGAAHSEQPLPEATSLNRRKSAIDRKAMELAAAGADDGA